MGKNIVKAKLDVIFKKMFTDVNNEDLLHDFLSSVLDIPYYSIKNIVVLNSEIAPETTSGKFSRLDLKIQIDYRLVNVELQVKSEGDYRDRALFYWSKLYSGDLKTGDVYGDLKQSISINIINFNIFDCLEFHSVFKIKEDVRNELLTDKLAIHFFELRKISKRVNRDNRKELWLQLINAESEEELIMLEQTNVPSIRKAATVIRDMSEDTRIREAARMREKMLFDEGSAMTSSFRKGKQEGKQEGIQIGKQEGIQKGKQEGMQIGKQEGIQIGKQEGMQQIINKMRLNGMSEEEINRILELGD